VASTTLTEPLSWRNSTLLEGDAVDTVAKLKEGLDENLVVFGSGVLVRSLLPHNLVDELVLLTHALVLGSGRRLFTNTSPAHLTLQMIDSTVTGTGVVIATYGAPQDPRP
jgi:dihydrofolate reductase